jgi:hypothetical protein
MHQLWHEATRIHVFHLLFQIHTCLAHAVQKDVEYNNNTCSGAEEGDPHLSDVLMDAATDTWGIISTSEQPLNELQVRDHQKVV